VTQPCLAGPATGLNRPSFARPEDIRAIDTSRLVRRLGTAKAEDLAAIRKVLRYFLDPVEQVAPAAQVGPAALHTRALWLDHGRPWALTGKRQRPATIGGGQPASAARARPCTVTAT
jgi:PemK-like, MazF-like toxin of type II toxin-antitoxin system